VLISYLTIIVAFSGVNASTKGDVVQDSIKSFEQEVKLPSGALPVVRYARFYKIIMINTSEGDINDKVSVVQFRYIHRNKRHGQYLIEAGREIPVDPTTDGGCLVIEGFFGLDTRELLNIECAPQR
jgi:hypothetical protein